MFHRHNFTKWTGRDRVDEYVPARQGFDPQAHWYSFPEETRTYIEQLRDCKSCGLLESRRVYL